MMRGRWLVVSVLLLGLMLGAAVGLGLAQGGESEGGAAPQALVGTGFTYQGKLDKGGSPYTGQCDFKFSLYDALDDGFQIGGTQTIGGVDVEDGLFTVVVNSGNEFGAGAFNGQGRWLAIEVQCSGDGGYTPLDPRQALTPSPYALALPGLWTEQNYTSPNLIGGYWGNSVAPNVVGATIGGGGSATYENQVAGDYATVSGGYNNLASGALAATVGGGEWNTASGAYSTVAGGHDCTASGQWAAVGGGWGHTASGQDATVGGGYYNDASGNHGTVGGGRSNVAAGEYATVGGGWDNEAAVDHAAVGGGAWNVADGIAATVAGGEGNSALRHHATVGGGEANTVQAGYSTVGGGISNTVSSPWATLSGGISNTITVNGTQAAVGGGYGNVADGINATIGGGQENTASALNTTVGGGYNNTASDEHATVGGGTSNTASEYYATVPGGWLAEASHYGEMAYASGGFSNIVGTAQTSVYVLRRTSTGSSWGELFLDGSDDRLTIAEGRTLTFDIWVVGRSDGGESAGYHLWGVIENEGGTVGTIGGSFSLTLGEDDPQWNARIQSDNTNKALAIEVLGNGETIRWVAYVRTVEVAW